MRSSTNTSKLGQQHEDLALTFLLKKGLTLVERNYRSRFGEIDLIMQDQKKCIVFIEVRFRSSQRFGGAAASVDYKKQSKLIKCAQQFIANDTVDQAMRFDVIAISPTKDNSYAIQWITNAFDEF